MDSDYNLSDIDTTTQIRVNDLTIPVNIDNITLDDIISPSDDSRIKEYDYNGTKIYAVIEDGSFSSNNIEVPKFTAASPNIESTYATLTAESSGSNEVHFALIPLESTFKYDFQNIDKAVHDISGLYTTNLTYKIKLDFSGIAPYVSSSKVKNLYISIPKGLQCTVTAGSYNATEGKISVAELPLNNGCGEIDVTASYIDLKSNGVNFSYDTHSATMESAIIIDAGKIEATPKTSINANDFPRQLPLTVSYELSDVNVTAFTGAIEYDLDGININPINLSDMPDFLSQEGTSIFIDNPQIYLQLNNPVNDEKLSCSAGITLTAIREYESDKSFSLDNGSFTVGYNHSSGLYNYVFSPKNPAYPLSDFADNITHEPFTSLSDILAGDGVTSKVPDKVNINISNPQIPLQSVTGFKLGRPIDKVEGKYQFFAPLSLKAGSLIVYSDVIDGWNDEDVDAITIETLKVKANVTTDLPLEATVKIFPIDKDGNDIKDVEIEGGFIPANASNYELNVTATGVITHLDGIRIEARVQSDEANTLTPNKTITLSNIRPTVSGTYTKKL
jgi:hypothetical protein